MRMRLSVDRGACNCRSVLGVLDGQDSRLCTARHFKSPLAIVKFVALSVADTMNNAG